MPTPREEGSRAVDDPGRQESEAERDDRNVAELLQELRVAGLGVQVLFGFLLALPFSARFERLDGAQRDLYLTTILLAALGDGPAHRPRRVPPIGLSSAPEGPAPPGGQRDGPPRSGRRRARHLGGGPSRRRCRRARSGSAGRRSRHRGGLHRALVRLPDGPSTASRRMTQDRGHGLGGPASTSSGPRTAPRDHTARRPAGQLTTATPGRAAGRRTVRGRNWGRRRWRSSRARTAPLARTPGSAGRPRTGWRASARRSGPGAGWP